MIEHTHICNYKECKKPYTPESKFGKTLYCSMQCRNNATRRKVPSVAKTLECKNCGEPFKRRSAKDILCMECKERTEPVKEKKLPQLDEDVSRKMQEEWLKNNKVEVFENEE